MQLFPEFFITLFIDKNNPESAEVITQGVLYSRSFSIEYILVPTVFCTTGFFVGAGHSMFSMINNLAATFLLRVPISYFAGISAGATLFHVGLAAPAASLLTAIASVIFLVSGKWKK